MHGAGMLVLPSAKLNTITWAGKKVQWVTHQNPWKDSCGGNV